MARGPTAFTSDRNFQRRRGQRHREQCEPRDHGKHCDRREHFAEDDLGAVERIGLEDVRVLEIGTQVVSRELRPEQQDDHQQDGRADCDERLASAKLGARQPQARGRDDRGRHERRSRAEQAAHREQVLPQERGLGPAGVAQPERVAALFRCSHPEVAAPEGREPRRAFLRLRDRRFLERDGREQHPHVVRREHEQRGAEREHERPRVGGEQRRDDEPRQRQQPRQRAALQRRLQRSARPPQRPRDPAASARATQSTSRRAARRSRRASTPMPATPRASDETPRSSSRVTTKDVAVKCRLTVPSTTHQADSAQPRRRARQRPAARDERQEERRQAQRSQRAEQPVVDQRAPRDRRREQERDLGLAEREAGAAARHDPVERDHQQQRRRRDFRHDRQRLGRRVRLGLGRDARF